MDLQTANKYPLLESRAGGGDDATATGGGGGGADERERFSSRLAFYFAAVGSAVGFGNVWRFPSLVYEYGGGAFFIPYLLALFLVGIPLLVLEISLGQYFELGGEVVFSLSASELPLQAALSLPATLSIWC